MMPTEIARKMNIKGDFTGDFRFFFEKNHFKFENSAIFEAAAEFKQTGAIIFLDEIDNLFPNAQVEGSEDQVGAKGK